ncbi:hypothetical protein VNO80_03100 [Phaseolus coccineus]|uniref:Rab9 effector protein with kelch motifs n=1 Tax=Phaseolus coccineus TaxID=3886 RepID=A0AAN9NR34_PHACN
MFRVYSFQECCGGLHFGDVLCLDLVKMNWNKLATTGEKPGPRDSRGAVLVGHRMIVFGGTNGFKEGTPPSPRESHTATLVGDERLVIFGGSGEGEANYLNDLHVLDLQTMRWTSPPVKRDLSVPRDSHNTLAIGNRLFVYGGDCGDQYQGDVNLDIRGQPPQGQFSHIVVLADTDIAIYGGCGEDERPLNELLVLQLGA